MCEATYTMGVVKIDSDQQEAKNCYTSSMKSASKPKAT